MSQNKLIFEHACKLQWLPHAKDDGNNIYIYKADKIDSCILLKKQVNLFYVVIYKKQDTHGCLGVAATLELVNNELCIRTDKKLLCISLSHPF